MNSRIYGKIKNDQAWSLWIYASTPSLEQGVYKKRLERFNRSTLGYRDG